MSLPTARQALRGLQRRWLVEQEGAQRFSLLALPWVRQAVVGTLVGLPGDVAAVPAGWKAFGALPLPQWGLVWAG